MPRATGPRGPAARRPGRRRASRRSRRGGRRGTTSLRSGRAGCPARRGEVDPGADADEEPAEVEVEHRQVDADVDLCRRPGRRRDLGDQVGRAARDARGRDACERGADVGVERPPKTAWTSTPAGSVSPMAEGRSSGDRGARVRRTSCCPRRSASVPIAARVSVHAGNGSGTRRSRKRIASPPRPVVSEVRASAAHGVPTVTTALTCACPAAARTAAAPAAP